MKIPVAFHTEMVFDERVWVGIKKFVDNGNTATWFVITPMNYEFARVDHNFTGTKAQYERKIFEHYKWLKEHDQKLQLHVHLAPKKKLVKTQRLLDEKTLVTGSYDWMIKNGFDVNKITFGWWQNDKISKNWCGKNRLKIAKRNEYIYLHDWDLIGDIQI